MNNPELQISDADAHECQVLQKEEFDVLESIYPECISSQITEGTLKLEIPIEFEEPRNVNLTKDCPSSPTTMSCDRPSESVTLSTLPSLLIELTLPPSYPLYRPPQLVSIRATHFWLARIPLLHNALTNMWNPGEGALYQWVEFLRTGDFLQNLDLVSSIDMSIQLSHPSPHILAPLLIAYDTSSKSSHFSQNSYPCSICLTSLKGSKCLELTCGHIFCRTCLEDFWKMCIEEGDVGRVGCPDPDCVKAGREAVEVEVARVVTDAGVKRWRWLREKRNLDKDPTIIHCPVAACQAPVMKPTDVDQESGWGRLRQCSQCFFSFCAFCRRTWHGPITPCTIAHSEKLVLEYLAAEEGSAERHTIEKRFGRANVQKLVLTYEEEKANKEWLHASTMECPGCQCHVEKSLGCNHMTCWKCRQHFCYRCGERLAPSDPYTHFSIAGKPCYNKLFDFQAEDADWQPVEDRKSVV